MKNYLKNIFTYYLITYLETSKLNSFFVVVTAILVAFGARLVQRLRACREGRLPSPHSSLQPHKWSSRQDQLFPHPKTLLAKSALAQRCEMKIYSIIKSILEFYLNSPIIIIIIISNYYFRIEPKTKPHLKYTEIYLAIVFFTILIFTLKKFSIE